MKFFVHIGLPKTGTTVLQNALSTANGIRYFHKYTDPDLIHDLRGYVNGESRDMEKYMTRYSSGSPNIISDENITIHWKNFWQEDFPHIPPVHVLSHLQALYRDQHVIFGVRDQATWLASRYAESAKVFDVANQEDFEQRVFEVVSRNQNDWLYYDYVIQTLRERFRFVHVLYQEELDFTTLEAVMGTTLECSSDRLNSLQLSSNTWQLKGHDETITLTPELISLVADQYGEYYPGMYS